MDRDRQILALARCVGVWVLLMMTALAVLASSAALVALYRELFR